MSVTALRYVAWLSRLSSRDKWFLVQSSVCQPAAWQSHVHLIEPLYICNLPEIVFPSVIVFVELSKCTQCFTKSTLRESLH